MDKRDLASLFRDRLARLIEGAGLSQAAFAASVGIDRSALSQLLSGATTRLPRAETLLNIAAEHKVTLDWLMGLSQDEGSTGELRATLEIEEEKGDQDQTMLATWHAEAAGAKIRYVPAGLPDLLRSDDLIAYEARISHRNLEAKIDEAQYRVAYNRRPETDMEVCMPRHTLEIFAEGRGIWSDAPASLRRRQLAHMADLVEELYPAFRLYLYDGRSHYSIPYTIFGQIRAAIYVGDMYLVLNATQPIRTLTRHFDQLIRGAEVHAHEAADFARSLARLAVDRT
jgi:transcriptional regulator with XRE-family HTH domain